VKPTLRAPRREILMPKNSIELNGIGGRSAVAGAASVEAIGEAHGDAGAHNGPDVLLGQTGQGQKSPLRLTLMQAETRRRAPISHAS
jgi:hypothetical protein